MRYFGLHLVGVQPEVIVNSTTNTKSVSSYTHLGSNAEFKSRENVVIALKNRPPSEAGTESSWEIDGHRWINMRAQAGLGIDMQGAQPPEIFKRLMHEAAMA